MKKKIIGIIICTLLIAMTIPVVGTIDTSTQPETFSAAMQGVIDQSQERDDECIWFDDAWQEFVPVGELLLHVEVKIKQGYEGSPDLWLYIEKPLGTTLASMSKKATEIPNTCDWVEFDIEDINLVPGDTYYIHLKHDPGAEYAWGGANGDLYPAGDSDLGAQWDYCFRTYVDKSKTSDDPEETDLKKTLVWGTILFPRIRDKYITFRAVRVHYRIFGERESGTFLHKKLTFDTEFKGTLRNHWVCAVFDGTPMYR